MFYKNYFYFYKKMLLYFVYFKNLCLILWVTCHFYVIVCKNVLAISMEAAFHHLIKNYKR